jgi:cadmium resistance protein CadD (predicted permease)
LKKLVACVLHLLLFLFASIAKVKAADNSAVDQFLGSPLLILAAILVIDAVAFLYHKIRK